MAYWTIDDVRAVLPKGVKIDGDTADSPISASVSNWNAQVEGELNDAFASRGISVPITDPNLVLRLRFHGSRKVAWEILATRELTEDDKGKLILLGWNDAYKDLLKKIEVGSVVPGTSDATLPWSSTMDADETDPSDPKNPAWTRDYEP